MLLHGAGPSGQLPGDWTFVKRQEAASLLLSPSGASDGSPGREQRQELGTAVPAGPALGQRSHYLFPLPQHGTAVPVFCVGGEGQGEGARPCPLAQIMLRAEKDLENNETRDSATHRPPHPTSPPESPEVGRSGGERRRIGRNANPGRREGGQRSRAPALACPGLPCDAPTGLSG